MLSKMVYKGHHNKGEPNLRMREIYKLRTIDNLTFREIGEEFDLTRERVRQIKEQGIQRLRARRDKSTQEVKDQYVFMNGEWITK